MDVAAMALEYNATEPEMSPEYAEMIRNGEPFIRVVTQSPGLGHAVNTNAMLLIRLADGSLAAADDPRFVKIRRRRGFDRAEKIATWWGRKQYGKDLPIEHM